VRLADEGVPLRAIARATNTPSDILRDRLHEAQAEGKLLGLPREDWPPGFPRDQRALRLSRMVTQDPETASLAMQQVFRLTPTEASLLMILIQSPNVPRERLGMTYRTVDVHICHIRRRLAPYQISISTLWGYGYQLAADGRRRIMNLILTHTGTQWQSVTEKTR